MSQEAIKLAKDFAKDDSIAKVIAEIGTGKACFTQGNIDDLREALQKGGWDAAEAKAAQFAGVDAYTDLLGIIAIMRKHNLSPEAGAEVLKNIFQIKAGHW
jgi:hypothetical protein